MKRLALIVILAGIAILVAIPAAYAATTDLNNIPITDTLEEGTMEWDVSTRFSDDFFRGRRMSSRLFVALFDNFEFGMSWGISRRTSEMGGNPLVRGAGPVELSLKYKILDEYDGGFPVSLAVGAEGITGNYDRTGMDPMYYGVIGIHDVHLGGWWDWYIGLAHNPSGFDDDDNSLFGGFKYWINDDWQFNADYMGRNDNGEYMLTGGVNYDWCNHIGFQGWVERDSFTEDNVFILEVAFSADMRDLTAEVSDPE